MKFKFSTAKYTIAIFTILGISALLYTSSFMQYGLAQNKSSSTPASSQKKDIGTLQQLKSLTQGNQQMLANNSKISNSSLSKLGEEHKTPPPTQGKPVPKSQPNPTASQAGQSANKTASQAGQSANKTASQAGQSANKTASQAGQSANKATNASTIQSNAASYPGNASNSGNNNLTKSNPIGGALTNTTKSVTDVLGKGISSIMNLGNNKAK
jgi:hypothetical protein